MLDTEEVIYTLIAKEIDSESFEQWLYSDKNVEKTISSSDYLTLIYIDYRRPSSLQEAADILLNYINIGGYYEWLLRRILNQIIDRPANVHSYIQQCYDLYCRGYDFLDNIGLGFGLHVAVPPDKFNAETWEQLNESEQAQLIDSFYPAIKNEAEKVIHWLDTDKIIFTEYDDLDPQSVKYSDNRNDMEKAPVTYKIARDEN